MDQVLAEHHCSWIGRGAPVAGERSQGLFAARGGELVRSRDYAAFTLATGPEGDGADLYSSPVVFRETRAASYHQVGAKAIHRNRLCSPGCNPVIEITQRCFANNQKWISVGECKGVPFDGSDV